MPPHRCRHCRQLVPAGRRCPCTPNTRTGYGNAERQRRARTVVEHLERHGPVCPGWRTAPHTVDPAALTADHLMPVAAGGAQHGELQVLCRSCNSRRGADRR